MPDTLFIVGDTHGQFDQLIRGLRAARLIGADRRWRGGRSHLVFAGDMTDRGPDVLALLWFIHGLQPQARAAGGDVHVVLGNHELMVMLGDLRYVHEKELFVAQQHGVPYSELFDPRHSVLGRWLASLPAMIRLGDVLVAHGGVTPEYARLMIEGANDSLALYLRDPATASLSRPATTAPDSAAVPPAEESAVDPARAAANARYRFLWDDRSIFWHRGYVRGDAPDAELAEALELTSARMLVVGHTGVVRIAPAYGGRVIAAHTPQFGAQLLMLVRTQDGVQRFRVGREGTEQF